MIKLRVVLGAIATIAATFADAQQYPYKPVRIVVPGTGGGGDLVARLIAQRLGPVLGQSVVVENRPTGVLPGQIVAKAQPDGYTLLLSGSGLWLAPFMYERPPFDPVKDFSPITLAVTTPNVLVVHPSVQAKSVQDLLAFAKAHPGVLNYASGSIGSANHLGAETFKALAGVNITRVNYKGAGPGLTALMAGEVQVMFVSAGSVAPHIKSGKVRALGVTSAQPTELVPGLPAIAASGLPGYESVTVYGIFAPARTPRPILDMLNRDLVAVLKTSEIKDRLFAAGAEPIGSSAQALAAAIKSDMTMSGKVIRDAGIQSE